MKYFRPTSVAAVVLATFALGASAQEQKGVSEVERNYQALRQAYAYCSFREHSVRGNEGFSDFR